VFGATQRERVLVASGEIDATVRKTPLYEWDLAAADCILREAGGTITNLLGEEFIYNQQKTLIEGGVLASNPFLHKLLLPDTRHC
jgi:fructose-1,6-bisphosphatase/inositol monophosphatase family enzyme